jgi:hypothetical protein
MPAQFLVRNADGSLTTDPAAVELASVFTVVGTTLAAVTGLAFTLKANATYIYAFDLLITQATATGIVGVGVNYSGTLSRIATLGILGNAAATASFQAASANNTALVDSAARAIGGPRPTRVSGSITTTAAGVLTLMAQRSAGVTTILAGSSGMARQI